MKLSLSLTVLVILAFLLVACGSARGSEPALSDLPPSEATVDPQQPVRSDDPMPVPEEPEHGELIIREAAISEIQLLFLESFPLQLHVLVSGELGDGCTTLGPITTGRDGDTFKISVQTSRPAEAMCTLALSYFEESIPLDIYGLEAGRYTVDVNGVRESFNLDVDNILGGEDGQGATLSDEDYAELIRLSLERALIDQKLPDYQLLPDHKRVVLSTENIDSSWVPTLAGLELVLLSPEEIQALANEKGDFLHLRFSDIAVKSADEVHISLNNNWARAEDSEMVYLSGGGFTIEFNRTADGWQGEIVTLWIS